MLYNNPMKKLGIIVDSFSSKTKNELDQIGFGFIPLQIEIDNELYIDGLSMDQHKLLNMIKPEASVKTSLPRFEEIETVITKFCNEYDHVLFLGISSHLSSTFDVVSQFGNQFSNFTSFDNNFVGEQYITYGKYAQEKYAKTGNIEAILDEFSSFRKETVTYIFPRNLKRLIGGGRLRGVKKFIMQAFKFLPIIKFDEQGKVGVVSIKRTISGALKYIFKELQDKAKDVAKFIWQKINGIDEELSNMLLEEANELNIKFDYNIYASPVIISHTGNQAIAVSVMPRIKSN